MCLMYVAYVLQETYIGRPNLPTYTYMFFEWRGSYVSETCAA